MGQSKTTLAGARPSSSTTRVQSNTHFSRAGRINLSTRSYSLGSRRLSTVVCVGDEKKMLGTEEFTTYNMQRHTHTRTNTNTHTHMHTHMHTPHAYAHATRTCTHTFTYTHTYTHTYTQHTRKSHINTLTSSVVGSAFSSRVNGCESRK